MSPAELGWLAVALVGAGAIAILVLRGQRDRVRAELADRDKQLAAERAVTADLRDQVARRDRVIANDTRQLEAIDAHLPATALGDRLHDLLPGDPDPGAAGTAVPGDPARTGDAPGASRR